MEDYLMGGNRGEMTRRVTGIAGSFSRQVIRRRKNKIMSINSRKVDAASYLKRIGYRGPLTPHIDLLRRLHHRHLLSVPFENLDIHLGRPVTLYPTFFSQTIVG